MFGFRFIKFEPNIYVLKYRNGKIVKQGAGLSFYYYAPITSLVAVTTSSIECPFIFEEVTNDFQDITIQGQVSYRISDPVKIAQLLNFTLNASGRGYISDDPKNLSHRVINVVKVLIKKKIEEMPLRDALKSSEKLPQIINEGIKKNSEINSLGLEILGLSILAIKPNQETARALEATAREQILKEADDAIYIRRNASVEQERIIKENELNTEIAVENKKKQIRETQMEAEKAVQEKQHQLEESNINFKIEMEQKNQELVKLSTANAKIEAEAKAYQISSVMKAFNGIDPAVIQTLASMEMNPNKLIAMAFQEIAEKADKIGQLNISPDLMKELLERSE
jgi:regulator of protease activity HflC (stomatin/prohibitin superfamily)